MGGGIVINGRLLEGACGNAGEVGHIRLAPRGPFGCGKEASFEGFCSGGGLPNLANFLPPSDTPSNIQAWKARHPNTETIAQSAREGDPTSCALFEEAGTRLGQALAILIDTLNPERIVIGSLYLRCQDLLYPSMHTALQEEALPSSLEACKITPSLLGEDLGNYGAICAALHGENLF